MYKSCSFCGKFHEKKFKCPKAPSRNDNPTKIDKFRWSSLWKSKRNEIAVRDKFLCQLCCRGMYCDKVKYISDIQVHHIVPIAFDWDRRLDNENLISLCNLHHELSESGKIPASILNKIAIENEKTSPPALEVVF